jgi:hypothetical protein
MEIQKNKILYNSNMRDLNKKLFKLSIKMNKTGLLSDRLFRKYLDLVYSKKTDKIQTAIKDLETAQEQGQKLKKSTHKSDVKNRANTRKYNDMKKKNYILYLIMYKQIDPEKDKFNTMKEELLERPKRIRKHNAEFRQCFYGRINLLLTSKEFKEVNKYLKKDISPINNFNTQDEGNFYRMMERKLLYMSGELYNEHLKTKVWNFSYPPVKMEILAYMAMFKIFSIDEDIKEKPIFLIDTEDYYEKLILRNTNNISIYNRYCLTPINIEATQFNNLLINNKTYNINNSCLINCMLEKFNACFFNKNGVHYLTREKILNIIDKKDLILNEFTPLSIDDVKPFFDKYELGLVAYNSFNKVVCRIEPGTLGQNNKLRPILRILIKNDHCYLMDDNIKELSHIDGPDSEEEKPLSKYYKTKDEIHEVNILMINELNDILEHIKQCIEEKEYYFTFIHKNNNLEQLLFELLEINYIPKFSVHNGMISNISIKFNNGEKIIIFINIINQVIKGEFIEEDLTIEDIQTYNNLYKINEKLQMDILKKSLLSTYNKDDLEIELNNKIIPLSIKFNNNIKYNKVFELDKNKCYTYILTLIKKIPIFNTFDKYIKYNGEEIEKYNYYYIESKKLTILTPNRYNRVYGFNLMLIMKNYKVNEYNIIAVKKPSNLLDCNYKDIIEELYNNKISNDEEQDKFLKKYIINIITGLMEKKYNKRENCNVFKSLEEAILYRDKYGYNIQELKPLQKIEIFEEDEEDNYTRPKLSNIQEDFKTKYYIIKEQKSQLLENGFKYIKELIYEINNRINYLNYKKLQRNKINVIGLKTDAFLIPVQDMDKVISIFNISGKIGDYKIKEKNINSIPTTTFELNINTYTEIKENTINNINIQNEYNTIEFIKHLKPSNNLIVKAEIPGAGKTWSIILSSIEMNKNLLIVSPNNLLCQQLLFDIEKKEHNNNIDSITLHNLLGISINSEENIKKHKFNIEEFNIILFDEIYFYDFYLLSRIKNYMLENNNIIFVSTGDINQLPPITRDVNNVEYDNYKNFVIDDLFNNQIYLKINKRTISEEDKDKILNIKQDLLINNINIMDIIHKYNFKTIDNMNDIKTIKNISYYNKMNKLISEHVHYKLLNNETKYYTGLNVLCRSNNKLCKDKNNKRLFTNFQYKIMDIDKKECKLYDELTKTEYLISLSKLETDFILPYAYTGHSSQGLTINEEITIFNALDERITRQWLWVSITRTRKLSDITFYINNDDVIDFKQQKIIEYFNNKVNGYIEQDKNKNFEINKNEYINFQWFNNQLNLNSCCSICKIPFEFSYINGRINSNITANRINNNLPHIINNSELLCNLCNCSLSDK